ncbi:hypothetical protein ACOME3_009314 [Neoechinorhynchus agilis]
MEAQYEKLIDDSHKLALARKKHIYYRDQNARIPESLPFFAPSQILKSGDSLKRWMSIANIKQINLFDANQYSTIKKIYRNEKVAELQNFVKKSRKNNAQRCRKAIERGLLGKTPSAEINELSEKLKSSNKQRYDHLEAEDSVDFNTKLKLVSIRERIDKYSNNITSREEKDWMLLAFDHEIYRFVDDSFPYSDFIDEYNKIKGNYSCEFPLTNQTCRECLKQRTEQLLLLKRFKETHLKKIILDMKSRRMAQKSHRKILNVDFCKRIMNGKADKQIKS